MRKTVALLGEADSSLAGLTGHLLMTVQDHLGGERRRSADLDGDVPPLGIEDRKRVVVHIGLLGLQVMMGAYLPYRCLGAAHQNEKQPLRDLGSWPGILRLARLASSCWRSPA